MNAFRHAPNLRQSLTQGIQQQDFIAVPGMLPLHATGKIFFAAFYRRPAHQRKIRRLCMSDVRHRLGNDSADDRFFRAGGASVAHPAIKTARPGRRLQQTAIKRYFDGRQAWVTDRNGSKRY